MQQRHSTPFGRGTLNTLAQSGSTHSQIPAVIIQGQGSELTTEKVLKGRAKRKIIAQRLALALVDIAKRKEDAEMVKAFWNTYHCQNHIISHENRMYGKYCKNRHCPLCCSIRKATLINQYLPIISTWETPHFVTLTVKACKSQSLPKRLKDMIRGFKIITTKYRKTIGAKTLIGIRALECCFNPVKRTYNPHFHVLVPDKATAETLIREWLTLCTPKFAVRAAQDMQPIRNLERGLIEVIKYGAKIFTEPDLDKKLQSNADPTIYAAALYNIYDGMKGLRLFDRFGFNLPKTVTTPTPARIITDYTEWFFAPQYHDWLQSDSEQSLSNYTLPAELEDLLKNHIDKETE